jgi:biotin-dependent carboxylase-like uncharacterized protein
VSVHVSVRVAVARVAGLATVQDRGRPGRLHEGVPPGGAFVPEGLARANARVHNGAGDAAIELFGTMTLVADGPVVVATDDGLDAAGANPRCLAPGEPWTVASGSRRVVYAAVRGGIDVPVVLGGRGTLLVAGLGGWMGRALRKDDMLPVGAPVEAPAGAVTPLPPEADLTGVVRVVPGPDLERFAPDALGVLLTGVFTIAARSDRVGVRLTGPSLLRADADQAVSGPMVRGAIQVPASGEPIVLGPDHPTTGGYPVLATVVSTSWGAVTARPIGARISFATARPR